MRGLHTVLTVALIGVAFAGPVPAAGAETPEPRELEIELIPSEQRMQGRLTLPAAMLAGDEGNPRFRLAPGLQVDAVQRGGESLPWEHDDAGYLEVELGDGDDPEAGGPALVIEYGARLQDPSGARPGGGFLGEDGGFLPAGADWYPRRPAAEPAPVRLSVTTADGHRAVASGSWVETDAEEPRNGDADTTRATFEHPGGRALALASGPWDEGRTETADGVVVRTLFPPQLEQRFGETYREQTVDYLERFSEQFGAYGFDSFSVAAGPAPVGLAFSGFTLLGEQVVPLPFIPHTSLGHEVLHNWWGTGVYADRDSGNWTEGVTTFMADYQFAAERGEAREQRGQWLRDYAAMPASEDYPHGEFRGGNAGADRVAGYHRGAMLWRMLQDRIGEAALNAGLQAFYARHLYAEAGWPELMAAVDEAHDDALEPFFEQWIGRVGAPQLALADIRRHAPDDADDADDADGWKVTARLEQADADHPWRLDVPVVIEFAGDAGQETRWVTLEDEATELEFALEAEPARMAVDPDWRVFRHLGDDEYPRILREAALDPDAAVITPDGAAPEELAPWLGRVPSVDADADADDAGAGTRVVLGSRAAVRDWLAQQGLPEHPAGVHDELDGVAADALAWTVPGSDVIVLTADSAAQRRALAGSLRHRAEESYLLEDDGEIVARGHWPVPGPWQTFED